MFRITIKAHGDPLEWQVWASLEEPDAAHPLEEMPESFILGTGTSPAAAKQAALEALVDAQTQIFAWRGDK